MVRWWGLWALGLCLFTQNLTAKEIAGEWILKLNNPRSWESVANSLSGWVKTVRPLGKSKRYALIRAPHLSLLFILKITSHIGQLQPNYRYQIFSESDPDFQKSWALSNSGQNISDWGSGLIGMDLHMEEAWNISTGSERVKVAVLDTGIDRTHEDLQNNIPKDAEWGWNFIQQNNQPLDDNGHGSFCAGIIGADWNNNKGTRGINERVSLLSVKVLDFLGQGSTASAIEGIEYAIAHGAHVINASWGGKQYDPALFDTVKRATEKGILFVAAAGNSGQSNDDRDSAIYPASFNLPGVLSVAAYDPIGKRTDFSNFGSGTVHVGAPGLEIFGVEKGGYGFRSGTSFAAPHVSGVAALLKSIQPGWQGSTLKDAILKTAQPLHPYEKYFTKTGAFIHAENALKGIIPSLSNPPIQWKRMSFLKSTNHPYGADTEEVFTIKEPGASSIRVHFKKFSLEKKFDYVLIKDREDRLVFTYSGDFENTTSVEALGDEIKIIFKSDYNRQQYGFDIDYYEAGFNL